MNKQYISFFLLILISCNHVSAQIESETKMQRVKNLFSNVLTNYRPTVGFTLAAIIITTNISHSIPVTIVAGFLALIVTATIHAVIKYIRRSITAYQQRKSERAREKAREYPQRKSGYQQRKSEKARAEERERERVPTEKKRVPTEKKREMDKMGEQNREEEIFKVGDLISYVLDPTEQKRICHVSEENSCNINWSLPHRVIEIKEGALIAEPTWYKGDEKQIVIGKVKLLSERESERERVPTEKKSERAREKQRQS